MELRGENSRMPTNFGSCLSAVLEAARLQPSMLIGGVTLLIATYSPSDGLANYLGTYADWRQMTANDKAAYAMGLFDASVFAGADDESQSIAVGLATCGVELKLGSNLVVQAIDSYYSSDTKRWDQPPILAFHEAIVRGACLKVINNTRAKYGLPPWKASDQP